MDVKVEGDFRWTLAETLHGHRGDRAAVATMPLAPRWQVMLERAIPAKSASRCWPLPTSVEDSAAGSKQLV